MAGFLPGGCTMTRVVSRVVDPVAFLGAVYRLDLAEAEWLDGMLGCCESVLDVGDGLCGYAHDVAIEGHRGISLFRQTGSHRRYRSMFDDLHDLEPTSMYQFVAPRGFYVGCGSSTDGASGPVPERAVRLFDEGVRDSVFMMTFVDGNVLTIGAPSSTELRLRADAERQWRSLMKHVTAAYRLRLRLATSTKIAEVSVERGDVDGDEMTSPLRAEILRVAREREAFFGRERSNVDGGSQLFRALIAGRFSLVDQWDSHGKRHVLVRDNAETDLDPRALTTAELRVARGLLDGRSTKELACDLGVRVSTVTSLGSNAYRKLGVVRRSELMMLAQATLAGAAHVPVGHNDFWLVSLSAHLPTAVMNKLTAALVDVLLRLMAGCSTKEIARARGTSIGTIEKQVSRIYATLGIRCRGDLVTLWKSGGKPIRS